jgi:hypothetical protein
MKSLPSRGVPRHVWTRFCIPLALSVTLESTVVSPETPEYSVIPANIFRNNDLEVFQETSVTRIRYLRENSGPTPGRVSAISSGFNELDREKNRCDDQIS